MKKGKLFVQIPCLNEEATIAGVIKGIPKKELKKLGFQVKVLVIDDGSSDKTLDAAKKSGVDFIIRHKKTLGLAKSFSDGLEFCLKNGADIIVNTDGDNQYDQREIIDLVKSIFDMKADMVIGDRQISKLKFMPAGNKIGNLIGSRILKFLTGEQVPDASSGFRAFSFNLAKSLNLQSSHTYTHESIIQASNSGYKIVSIPVTFKKRSNGGSRLIQKGIYNHIKKSTATIVRAVLLYKAFKYMLFLSIIFMACGFLIGLRFVYFFYQGLGTGHIQSLVLSSVLLNLGFVTMALGFIADLISINRKILEKINSKLAPKGAG